MDFDLKTFYVKSLTTSNQMLKKKGILIIESIGKYRTHSPFRLSSSMATMVAGGPPLASLQSKEKIIKDYN